MKIPDYRYFQYSLLLPVIVFAVHDYLTLDLTRRGEVSQFVGLLISFKDYIPYGIFAAMIWLVLRRLSSTRQILFFLITPLLYAVYFYTTLFWWINEGHLMKHHLVDFIRIHPMVMLHGFINVAGIAALIGYVFVVPVTVVYFAIRTRFIPSLSIQQSKESKGSVSIDS